MSDMDAAGGSQESHISNLNVFDDNCQVDEYTFTIPVDSRTDYIQVCLSVERTATNFSSAANFAVLNIAAIPIR